MAAAAEETIAGIAAAVEMQTAEFHIGWAGRERARAEFEHGRSVGWAAPDEIDGAVATALVNDPGGGLATLGRSEGRVQLISAREKADERTRPGGSGGAQEGFGRRRIPS